ncbi:MAG: spermidine synthase [Nocardioides sp.]
MTQNISGTAVAGAPHSCASATACSAEIYSSHNFLLNTSDTLLAGDRVFVGNQPDDVALAVAIQPRTALILGAGYGGNVRTLAAAAPDCRITTVDIDANVAQAVQSLFSANFPAIYFTSLVGDAGEVVQSAERYDLIVVDLYQRDSYPELVFDIRFWQCVKDSLTSHGAVLVNAWGLPEYLRPFEPPSPQLQLAQVIARLWPEVKYLPYRRNLSFLVGDWHPRAEALMHHLNQPRLSDLDNAVLAFHSARLSWAMSVKCRLAMGSVASDKVTSADLIDKEMYGRWVSLMNEVRKCGNRLGREEREVSGLAVYDPAVAKQITLELLRIESAAAGLIPAMAASLSFEGDDSMSWFGEWIAEKGTFLFHEYPQWTMLHALPQALALAANPLSPRYDWTDALIATTGAVVALTGRQHV